MSRAHHSGPDRPGQRSLARARDVARVALILVALAALLATSSATGWVARVQAADDPGPLRALVISGPVHSLTFRYRDYAKAIAAEAEAQGMVVKRLLYPNATPDSVKKSAQGVNLLVYVGHGNGWPSPYPPFQEGTKNGLGLSPTDPAQRSTSNVIYKGADWLRANIKLAPDAVVILSHLSYASGNASSGMPIPTRNVAIQRIDNFANGFLSIGARVVWALGWQPGGDVVKALFQQDGTMDSVFMTRFRDGVNPLNGWIGWQPGYYPSDRIPGAVVHIDPDPSYGFLRGLTGDLEYTTTEWRDPGSLPDDTEPPVLSGLSASQSAATLATAGDDLPVFTPNGDRISDSIKISHTLSESAFLDVVVSRDGNDIRHMTLWSQRGAGATSWDGKRDDGTYVGEGPFRITITPRDRAGNVGEAGSVKVKVLNAMKAPVAMPPIFDPTDGDALAQSTILKAKLTKPASMTWLVLDKSGAVVRHGFSDVDFEPGPVRFTWDGTDDDGKPLPRGIYTGRVRVTRAQGSYGHEIKIRLAPFQLKPSRWTLRRGDTVALRVESAEKVKGKAAISANRKGVKRATLKVRRVDAQTFTAMLRTTRGGKPGRVKIRVASTDVGGGTQVQYFYLKLR